MLIVICGLYTGLKLIFFMSDDVAIGPDPLHGVALGIRADHIAHFEGFKPSRGAFRLFVLVARPLVQPGGGTGLAQNALLELFSTPGLAFWPTGTGAGLPSVVLPHRFPALFVRPLSGTWAAAPGYPLRDVKFLICHWFVSSSFSQFVSSRLSAGSCRVLSSFSVLEKRVPLLEL